MVSAVASDFRQTSPLAASAEHYCVWMERQNLPGEDMTALTKMEIELVERIGRSFSNDPIRIHSRREDELATLLAIVRRLDAEVQLLRGAMKADDERLRTHGKRVGFHFDCDTAEHMADEIIALREQLSQARKEAEEYEERYRGATRTPVKTGVSWKTPAAKEGKCCQT